MDVKLNLSQDDINKVITATVQSAVIEALGKNPEATVAAVVKSALSQKKNDYSRETVLQAAVNEMIQAAAKDAFSEWLAANKEKARTALLAALGDSDGRLVHRLTEAFTEGLANSFRISVNLHSGE